MGLTPHEYYCMSPLEFHYAAKGYMNKHWKQWDMVRFISYNIKATIPSRRTLPKITAWMPLPIDTESHNENDVKEMFAKLKEKIKAHGNKRTTG